MNGEVGRFEAAVDAIIGGDLPALESLIRRNPDLVRARSTRDHHATLLHYVAANGVEDARQMTPPNAVEIARCLLEAGAEVDALANTYGGGKAQTTMNLLVSSVHPAKAGLQEALVELLLDFGAAINGLEDEGTPLMTALAFGYSGAADTLVRRGARVDNVVAAAALGRADLVDRLCSGGDAAKPALAALHWIRLPRDLNQRIELALVWASAYGRTAVVKRLLDQGVDPAAKDKDDMTALHWAAANTNLDVVKLLLRRGAPLESMNRWGGTVLSSTLWFLVNQSWFPRASSAGDSPAARDAAYAAVIDELLEAGADITQVPASTGHGPVDDVLARHRDRPS